MRKLRKSSITITTNEFERLKTKVTTCTSQYESMLKRLQLNIFFHYHPRSSDHATLKYNKNHYGECPIIRASDRNESEKEKLIII